jgi:hypothetical protein
MTKDGSLTRETQGDNNGYERLRAELLTSGLSDWVSLAEVQQITSHFQLADHGQVGPVQAVTTVTACRKGGNKSDRHNDTPRPLQGATSSRPPGGANSGCHGEEASVHNASDSQQERPDARLLPGYVRIASRKRPADLRHEESLYGA